MVGGQGHKAEIHTHASIPAIPLYQSMPNNWNDGCLCACVCVCVCVCLCVCVCVCACVRE